MDRSTTDDIHSYVNEDESAGQEVVLSRRGSAHSLNSEDWDPGVYIQTKPASNIYGPPLRLQNSQTGKTSCLEDLLSHDREIWGSSGLLGPACFSGELKTKTIWRDGCRIPYKVFNAYWKTTPVEGKLLDEDSNVVCEHVTEQAEITVEMGRLPLRIPDGRAYNSTPGLASHLRHLATQPFSSHSSLTHLLRKASVYESYDPVPNTTGLFALREVNTPAREVARPLEVIDVPGTLWCMDRLGRDGSIRGRFEITCHEVGTLEPDKSQGVTQEKKRQGSSANTSQTVIFEAGHLHNTEPVSVSSFLDNDLSITPRGFKHAFAIGAIVTAQNDGSKLVNATWETTPLEGQWYTRGPPADREPGSRRGRARIDVHATLPPESAVPPGNAWIRTRGILYGDDVSQSEVSSNGGDVFTTIEYDRARKTDGSSTFVPKRGSACSLPMEGVISWSQGGGKRGQEQASMTVKVQPTELYLPSFVKPLLQ
ncbi:hypothetical protein IAR50_002695 [Cryptococcus sp. DSM 104548]